MTAFQGISFRVSNGAEMTTQDIEIESQFALTEELEVGANIAYFDAPLSAGIYAGGVDEPRVYGLQAIYNF